MLGVIDWEKTSEKAKINARLVSGWDNRKII
jgi:hypothetical protein